MIVIKRSVAFFSFLILAGCATASQPAPSVQGAPQADAAPDAAKPDKAEPSKDEADKSADADKDANTDKGAGTDEDKVDQSKLPKLELSRKMFYDFLLGDVAAQRGNPELASKIYLGLAESTRDPRVVRRAAQLAFDAQQPERGLAALKLWLELDPASQQAKRMMMTVLLTGGRLEEAKPYIADALAAHPDKAGETLMQTFPLMARYPDKKAVLALLRELAAPYIAPPTDSAEIHWTLALAADGAGQRTETMDELHRARELRPDWELPVLAEAQILSRTDPEKSVASLQKFLETHPDARESRLLYARELVGLKRYSEAREEFDKLLAKNPDNADLALASAMLSLQMGEPDRAEGDLRKALGNGKSDPGTLYYDLGQLAEASKLNSKALEYYDKVTDGESAYPAHLRAAHLLFEDGKLDAARERLQQTPARDDQQRVELLLLEAGMLRDSKQPETAYQVLRRGLEKMPDQPDLTYETALLAEQLGNHDEFERLIRKLIAVKPSAQAYNAMGYSLLERNVRVKEGMELAKKALELAPDDAAIMDSVGWGYYRLGNLDKSLDMLIRAYAAMPDPEIAAHLGEVLWMRGDHQGARKVWDWALSTAPDNEPLKATMKKFLN